MKRYHFDGCPCSLCEPGPSPFGEILVGAAIVVAYVVLAALLGGVR